MSKIQDKLYSISHVIYLKQNQGLIVRQANLCKFTQPRETMITLFIGQIETERGLRNLMRF